jgi:hypothetical protein
MTRISTLTAALALLATPALGATCPINYSAGPMKIGQGLSRKGDRVPLFVAEIQAITPAGVVQESAIYNHQFEDVFTAGAFADKVNLACQQACSDVCYAGKVGWVVTP